MTPESSNLNFEHNAKLHIILYLSVNEQKCLNTFILIRSKSQCICCVDVRKKLQIRVVNSSEWHSSLSFCFTISVFKKVKEIILVGGCHERGNTVVAGTEAACRAVVELRCSSQLRTGWEGYQAFHLSYFILLTTLGMLLIVFLVYIVDSQTINYCKRLCVHY